MQRLHSRLGATPGAERSASGAPRQKTAHYIAWAAAKRRYDKGEG